jgi:hypothetical protein
VCYFLAIGAVADSSRLGTFFEEELDVDVARAETSVLVAFPAEDVVRLLTRRGCSCELLEPGASIGRASTADHVWLTPVCRRALAHATMNLGTIRIYRRSRREWQPGRLPRLTMAIEELLRRETAIPANVLVDLVVDAPSRRLN